MRKKKTVDDKRISILIVDDSASFRWLLKEIFEDHPRIMIAGEAANGIQGLDIMMKMKPDVIVMDMEMPLMDGMTALQHLMIHIPTPTVMISSLTKEGTVRSFDALKNGAVDFICKDIFFQGKSIEYLKEFMTDKVLNAANLIVRSQEPAFQEGNAFSSAADVHKVVFCEECGSREVVYIEKGKEVKTVICSKCGDRIHLDIPTKYIRNNFMTYIGAGDGGYVNLLNIIPKLRTEMSGSIIVQLYAESDHVDAFAQYLDSISNMKIVRIQDGLIIEGGNCYLASCNENITLKPYSANYTLRCSNSYLPDLTPLDAAMISIAGVFKDHVAGIILSGNEIDGEKGIRAIQQNNGSTFVLNPKYCLCKQMGNRIIEQCGPKVIEDEIAIVKKIESLHLKAKETVLTA